MRRAGIVAILLVSACTARVPEDAAAAPATPGKVVLARFEGSVDGATGVMTLRQVVGSSASAAAGPALLVTIPEGVGADTVRVSNDAEANGADLPAAVADACGTDATGYKGYVKVQSNYTTSNLQNLTAVIDTVSTGYEPCNAASYGSPAKNAFGYGAINSGQSATRAWIFRYVSAASFTFAGHVEANVVGLPILAAHLGNSSFALDGSRKLYAWGFNFFGQLGLGDSDNRNAPAQVGSGTNWVSVVPGGSFTLAVKNDGSLWAWGDNTYGQLGLGDNSGRNTPEQVGADTDWASVAAGLEHSLGVKKDGSLWAWGNNIVGELGLGDYDNRSSPTRVGTSKGWASVAAGNYHSLAVLTDGTLWSWGYNDFGQLGQGDTDDRVSPTQIGSGTNWWSVAVGENHSFAITGDGALWGWGHDYSNQAGYAPPDTCNFNPCSMSPKQVGSSTTWSAVVGGSYHSIGLQTDGTLWGWGRDSDFQLGIPAPNSCNGDPCAASPTRLGSGTSWAFIAAGKNHSLAGQGTETTLFSWGMNTLGQCGQGNWATPVATPTQFLLVGP